MGYDGDTLIIPLDRGGLVFTDNQDLLQPFDMVTGTKNLSLHNGVRESRGGTGHVNAVALTNAPEIQGMKDFQMKNGNQFLVMYSSDGKVWKDYTTTLGTLTPNLYPHFLVLDDVIYIFTGADVPQSWNGSDVALTMLTLIPIDWAGTNQPKWGIIQARGNDRRMIVGGCPNNPNTVYVSSKIEIGVTPNFSDACVKTYSVETGDGHGLVGAAKLGESVVVFGRKRSYFFDDSSLDNTVWGFKETPWKGGAAHQRLIVETSNDIVIMDEFGEIGSIVAVQESSDYARASLARPAFLDIWIRKNLDLVNDIQKFHMLYDPNLRMIRLFVKIKSRNIIDTCLKYYVDRPPNEAWMLDDNTAYASGFRACSAAVIMSSTGPKVYTGDNAGFVWELEKETKNDNGNTYYAGFTVPQLVADSPRTTKQWQRGWIIGRAVGNKTITIKSKIDGSLISSQSMLFIGNSTIWDTKKWNQFKWGQTKEIINRPFDCQGQGIRIQSEIYNESLNQGFYISNLMYDFDSLEKRDS